MTPSTVPLADLRPQYELIRRELLERWERILDQSSFVLGEEVSRFEVEFARYCGVRHAVGVANGTDAITLALRALKLRPGDEVIVPVNTFIATAEAVVHAGCVPVFADIDEATYTLDVTDAERRLTSRTRAIIAVHLYGQPADMKSIRALASAHDLVVVEDAAQAHGATYDGKKVGSLGHAACFSFYPGKNLGAYGDAGAVVTDDDDVARTLRMLRDHGGLAKYQHDVVGWNSRLDSLQAAVLSLKLKHLDEWNEARRRHATEYSRLLTGQPVVTPVVRRNSTHVFHQYVVRFERLDRDVVRSWLVKAGIQTGIHYPTPLHLTRAFAHLGYERGSFPTAERGCGQILSLPMFAELRAEQRARVVDAIRSAVSSDAVKHG